MSFIFSWTPCNYVLVQWGRCKMSWDRDFLFSNLDILNVLGAISMKFGMFCKKTLFQHITAYF